MIGIGGISQVSVSEIGATSELRRAVGGPLRLLCEHDKGTWPCLESVR